MISFKFRYLHKLGDQFSGSLQPTCSPGNKEKPHPTRSVPYSLALSDLRNLLTDLGYDGEQFSEHSSRRGAASHSAEVGISDQEIQLAGGWQSSNSMKLYIDRQPQQFQRINTKMFKSDRN